VAIHRSDSHHITETMQCSTLGVVLLGVVVALYLRADADLSLVFLADAVGLTDDAFAEKSVWIVGASTGIGAALAEEFATRGANVTLSSRRADMLEAVAQKCVEAGADVKPSVRAMDVLDEKERETVEDVDVLVLNAGRAQRNTGVNTTLAETRELLELNFFAVVDLARRWALLRGDEGGRIVVTSSVAGKLGVPVSSTYSASKFALHGYFEAMRVELMMQNVDVTLACPGPVVSDIGKHIQGPASAKDGAEDDDKDKMPTERCAYLMTVAAFHRIGEAWIAGQPFLLFTAISQYAPNLGKILSKTIGFKRVEAFVNGANVDSVASLLNFTFKK